MRVKLKYWIQVDKEMEISAKDYCELHANSNYKDYFPQKSFNRTVEIDGDKSFEELNNYFADQNN